MRVQGARRSVAARAWAGESCRKVLNAETDNAAVAGRAIRAIDDEIREVCSARPSRLRVMASARPRSPGPIIAGSARMDGPRAREARASRVVLAGPVRA
jgi:hypothetical protein